jgi:hypothetical protein
VKATRFYLIFGLIWGALTLVVDAVVLRALIGQSWSMGFPSVPGRVLASEIESDSDGEGTTYVAKIRYQYTVDGKTYESDRVRFGQMASSDHDAAADAVEAHPVDGPCTVYYNPRNPATSVLQTGVSGQDLFVALFLVPFNVVMVIIWGALWNNWRPAKAGGARIAVLAHRFEVRFAKFPPAAVGLMAAGGLALLLMFIIGFTSGFAVAVGVMLAAWSGLLAAWLAGFFWKRHAMRRQQPDLVIDSSAGTLTVSRGAAGRPAPLVVPLNRIRGIEMFERISSSGGKQSIIYTATLHAASGGAAAPSEHDVFAATFPGPAQSFVHWLRETLGVKSGASAP